MMKLKSKSKKKQQQQVSSARKCRTKTRKPKFLSLSKHIKSKTTPPPPQTTTTSSSSSSTTNTIITKMPHHHHHPQAQLTLFPLHPENLTEDTAVADLLFHSDSLPGESSLTGLLSSEHSPSSFDRVREVNDSRENDESLVRAAMKRRSSERDAGEEKWVCYSEVVEEVTSSTVSSSKADVVYQRRKKKKMNMTMMNDNCKTTTIKKVKVKDETTSSSVSQEGHSDNSLVSSSLALKLDYQGILKAWSDKGSLYIQPPQTVPDLQYDHNHNHLGLMDGWGSSVGNLWKVPENDCFINKEEMEGKEGSKLGQREASVLRYKEKRQSRLFAKRIRYEVRKLNAEKRPRMKGRFVKII